MNLPRSPIPPHAKRSPIFFGTFFVVLTSLMIVPRAAQAQSSVVWTNVFKGPGVSFDFAATVGVDSAGDVFVGGASGSIGSENAVVLKYSSAGVSLWTNSYNGPGNSEDWIGSLAVDGGGNVTVAGHSRKAPGSDDWNFLTIRYSGAGVPLWTNLYDGAGDGTDFTSGIAVDSSSNVVVTGWSKTSTNVSSEDFATIKYSSTGVPLWTNYYDGPGNEWDIANAVALDANGRVFVCGSAMAANSDIATVAYSSAGVPLWTNLYDGPAGGWDSGNALAVDHAGNVIVVGEAPGIGTAQDYVTIKYTSAGVPLWTNLYNGLGNDNDRADAVTVDGNGNVFVTGFSRNANGDSDFATLKYSPDGTPLWTNLYNGPGNDDDGASALAVDSNGNVFVTGTAVGINSHDDFVTIAYSNAGVPLRTNRYNGPGNISDGAEGIAVDGIGNVIVTGHADSVASGFDFVTVKYPSLSPGGTLTSIPLKIQNFGGQIVLTWSNAAFGLQSAPAATGTYTNVNGAASPHTNSGVNPQQFFRLKSN